MICTDCGEVAKRPGNASRRGSKCKAMVQAQRKAMLHVAFQGLFCAGRSKFDVVHGQHPTCASNCATKPLRHRPARDLLGQRCKQHPRVDFARSARSGWRGSSAQLWQATRSATAAVGPTAERVVPDARPKWHVVLQDGGAGTPAGTEPRPAARDSKVNKDGPKTAGARQSETNVFRVLRQGLCPGDSNARP